MKETKKDYIRKVDEKLFKLEKDISYLEKIIHDSDTDSTLALDTFNVKHALNEEDYNELIEIIKLKLEKEVDKLKDKHNKIEEGITFDDYINEEIKKY